MFKPCENIKKTWDAGYSLLFKSLLWSNSIFVNSWIHRQNIVTTKQATTLHCYIFPSNLHRRKILYHNYKQQFDYEPWFRTSRRVVLPQQKLLERGQSSPPPPVPALNTKHSTLNTQHSTLNTQHSTLNTQHSTLNAKR